MYDFLDYVMAGLIALMVILIGLFVYVTIATTNDCHERGGEMIGTGEYTTTSVMVGKVIVPQTTEIMECSK